MGVVFLSGEASCVDFRRATCVKQFPQHVSMSVQAAMPCGKICMCLFVHAFLFQCMCSCYFTVHMCSCLFMFTYGSLVFMVFLVFMPGACPCLGTCLGSNVVEMFSCFRLYVAQCFICCSRGCSLKVWTFCCQALTLRSFTPEAGALAVA